MGRENKSYRLQEIYKAFEDQLAGIASASTPSAGSSATATAPMVALDQSYDALYQAQQKIVLAVGSRYMYSNEMYQLQHIDAQKLVLEKVVLFDSQAAVLQVETASCHKHLKPTKNKVLPGSSEGLQGFLGTAGSFSAAAAEEPVQGCGLGGGGKKSLQLAEDRSWAADIAACD